MLKIILLVLLLVGLSAGTFFLVFMRSNTKPVLEAPKTSQVVPEFSSQESSPSSELLSELSKPIPQNADTNTKISLLENKIKALEQSNTQLSTRVSTLENNNSATPLTNTTTSSSTSKSPVFIPINSGGSIDSTSYTNLTSGNVTINPADYPGYTNMYLITNLSVSVGQGKAFARLVNTSSTLAILQSEVSTTSFSTVSLTSSPFQLPSGSNTYTVQLKTLVQGYPAQAGYSFIKVVF